MKLETHEGLIADPMHVDLAKIVAGLTAEGDAYIILSDDHDAETYVQAAGTVVEDFIVERRDGCAGEHYRGDRRISADELVAMLVGFLRGSTTWSHGLSWHHIDVDHESPSA